MKFKIKKSYYRLFSVLLSVIMIVISVPLMSINANATEEDFSGLWLFNNVKYNNKYIHINNVDNPGENEIIELHTYNPYWALRWYIINVGNGYYKIESILTRLVLTAPTGYNNDIVRQTTYTGANTQLWKFIKQADGTYKISPKSNHNCYLVPGAVSTVADQDLEISFAQSDGGDKWKLCCQDQNTVSLQVVYDIGYNRRYTSATSRISDEIWALQEKYLRDFGIFVNYTAPENFVSHGDNCSTNPETVCTHVTNALCQNSTNINLYSYHHKNIYNILYRIDTPTSSNDVKIAYIGHTCCRINNGGHTGAPYGLAQTTRKVATITNPVSQLQETKTMIHEFGHFYGVIDHYGIGCRSTAQIINETGNSSYNENCIYGENKDSYNVYSNFTICEGCKSMIVLNKSRYN